MKDKRKKILICSMLMVTGIGICCIIWRYWSSLKGIEKIAASFVSGLCIMIPVYIKLRTYLLENVPKICLKAINVSDIKRIKRRDAKYQINVGEGKYYIYVTIQMKNNGQGSIENCLINGKVFDADCVNVQEDITIMIASNKREGFNNKYPLKIEFVDDVGRKYSAVKLLHIDVEKKQASISTGKKQRRKFYGRYEETQ